jgi:hypothetical protein
MSSHPRGYDLFTSGHPLALPPASNHHNTHALARYSHTHTHTTKWTNWRGKKDLKNNRRKETENSGKRGRMKQNQGTNYDFRWPTGQTLKKRKARGKGEDLGLVSD